MKTTFYVRLESNKSKLDLGKLGTFIKISPEHKKKAYMLKVETNSELTVEKAIGFLSRKFIRAGVNSLSPTILEFNKKGDEAIFKVLAIDHD